MCTSCSIVWYPVCLAGAGTEDDLMLTFRFSQFNFLVKFRSTLALVRATGLATAGISATHVQPRVRQVGFRAGRGRLHL